MQAPTRVHILACPSVTQSHEGSLSGQGSPMSISVAGCLGVNSEPSAVGSRLPRVNQSRGDLVRSNGPLISRTVARWIGDKSAFFLPSRALRQSCFSWSIGGHRPKAWGQSFTVCRGGPFLIYSARPPSIIVFVGAYSWGSPCVP
jgi:hypothetical protein